MTAAELELAIMASGFRCWLCQSNEVVVRDEAGDLPVIRHWQNADGWWCPALGGGAAAALASLDLLEALAAVMHVADYGEPVEHEFALAAA
jgi:hypothetical protein